jgi:hypothetical protein
MISIRLPIVIGSLSMIGWVKPLAAQTDCSPMIKEAYKQAKEICSDLGRNQICYGNTLVSATSWDDTNLSNFNTPGSKTNVRDLKSLVTAPLNLSNNTWGLAILSLQTDLKEQVAGQPTTFVVFGDVEVNNEVEPGKIVAANSLVGKATRSSNLRAGPSQTAPVVGALNTDEAVTAIGRDPSGEWLQVVDNGKLRWVATRFIQTDGGDPAKLDVVDPKQGETLLYTAPMQAFRVVTRPTGIQCEEAPKDGVVIQAPKGGTINFLVNGIKMSAGSSVLLHAEDPGKLQVATLAGNVKIASGQGEQKIDPGYSLGVAGGQIQGEQKPYEYDDVHDLPLDLLPEAVNMLPPSGTEINMLDCNFKGGVYRTAVSKDKPVILTTALGGNTAESAATLRAQSNISLTLDGTPARLWSISDPYDSDSGLNATTGGQTSGNTVLQKWWYVVARPQPGVHRALLTWKYGKVQEYRCSFTVK